MLPIGEAAKGRAAATNLKRAGMTKAMNVYRIELETVSVADIATRLGVSKECARDRLRKLRGASGAVTWSRLGLVT